MIKIILATICLFLFASTASAYTYYDWHVDLSVAGAASKPYLNNNLPTGGRDIDYTFEDNADAATEWTPVGPGYSWYNYFDAEAMYFDNDATYAYIAVITGLPQLGMDPPGNTISGNPNYAFKPGDIGIDVDGISGYEYGINITDGKLYNVTGWNNALYSWADPDYNPYRINTFTGTGTPIDFTYSSAAINYHYVLEARVPLSLLGLSANPGDPIETLKLHWSMECGNDYLLLNADVNPTPRTPGFPPAVPEPATCTLLGLGLVALFGTRKNKLQKG